MFDGNSCASLIPTWLVVAVCVGVLSSILIIGYASVEIGRWLLAPAAATCRCDPDHCLCCRACTCKEPAK